MYRLSTSLSLVPKHSRKQNSDLDLIRLIGLGPYLPVPEPNIVFKGMECPYLSSLGCIYNVMQGENISRIKTIWSESREGIIFFKTKLVYYNLTKERIAGR